MGTCIICGTTVDGHVCDVHDEDVVFEFRGQSPSKLTSGRYYQGTVDGYADFGVFIDIGEHVTGLLHRSELDKRLESLDWEPGDAVYVQVLDVRDNGNVDLGWSIRQREREFRGMLIDTGDGQRLPEDDETDDDSADSAETDHDAATDGQSGADAPGATDPATNGGTSTAADDGDPAEPTAVESTSDRDESTSDRDESTSDRDEPALNRTTVDAIETQVGSIVRLEGEITSVRQTSGPTVFELRDETGTIECAAFKEAGVRAYPSVEIDDLVALEGEVERHHDDLQIETERLEVLSEEPETTVRERLEAAIEQDARPSSVALLAEHDPVAAVEDDLFEIATAIRRAVMETRPVIVRHSATADGYVAGAAIERAVLPLIREQHTRDDAVYHYFERRPLDGHVYDMDAATNDVTSMLEARDRHGEQLPLVVLADAGSTVESIDGYELLSTYGAEAIVIDDSHADSEIVDAVSFAAAPSLAGADVGDLTTTALAANVAAQVNDEVRDDLEHLPAVSYWESAPEGYLELAREAGYDETAIAQRREAVALEAYYQSYKDKRELVIDLLFDEGEDSAAVRDNLAAHVSEQFRDKLEAELETADRNLEIETVDDATVAVLDTGQFTHRYDFPTTDLLLDALHRRQREAHDEPFVTLGLDTAELRVRATEPVNVRELGEAIADRVPEGGVRTVGGHDGYVEFLVGEREAVREAALEALGEALA